jgi:hypothetical protein
MPTPESGNAGRHEALEKRSLALVGHDALLASTVLDEWLVHALWLPPHFPWRGTMTWAGNAVPADAEATRGQGQGRSTTTVAVGGGLASVAANVLGFAKAKLELLHAPPFATQAAAPVLTGSVRRSRAQWFVVATYVGDATGMADGARAPLATDYTSHAVTLNGTSRSVTLHADGALRVAKG